MKSYATDNDLVEACLKQRADAQRALYQKFSRQMLGICMRYTPNKMEAEDTLQIGFMKVFDHLNKFEGGSLEGWMKRIFVRTAIDGFRQKQREPTAKAQEPEEHHAIELEDVLGQLSVEEILFAIGQLPEGCRMVFNLFAVEGYSHVEIANMLGISDGTSRSQFSRAKLLLKEKIFTKHHG